MTVASTTRPTTSTNDEAASGSTFVRIKVRYFQMSDALPGVNQEYYVLPSPAHYPGLLTAVISSHPVLSGMMPNMLVLAEGIVAGSNTLLRDGDEVDFIPTVSGG
jgi:molybdopterin converting factor small subunit